MKTERFEMRTSAEFARAIDEWRRKQDSIPSRSDAVRTLVAQGLLYETLEKVIMDLMDFLQDSANSGEMSPASIIKIVDIVSPFLKDLELYTETKINEFDEIKKIYSEFMADKDKDQSIAQKIIDDYELRISDQALLRSVDEIASPFGHQPDDGHRDMDPNRPLQPTPHKPKKG